MYCPNCGGKCGEAHRFCFHCGSPLPENTVPAGPADDAAVEPEILPAPTAEPPQSEPVPAVAAPEPPPRKAGRLWPPFLTMALMIFLGISVFFATRSHIGTDPTMPWFYVDGGTLYFDAVLYTGGSELTVPRSIGGQAVTALSEDCFARCYTLTAIFLPESLTEIGPGAFAECTSLRGIDLPESLTAIGAKAFYNCNSLEAIRIPGTVTSIGKQAFSSCQSLRYIFFSGTYQQWTGLYSESIAEDTLISCYDGIHKYPGRP